MHDEKGRLMAGVRLEFRSMASHYAGERDNHQYATAVTDANGYYEVRRLPEELVHILSGRRGGDLVGVWHRTVQPASGKTRTVDSAAGATISGRLFINGVPRASARLLLSDESPIGDDFNATTTADANGAFVFTGVPRGRRHLYFSARQQRWGGDDWVRVRAIDVNTAARNLGRIDHRVGTVTVKVVGRRDDDTIADLYSYDPSLIQFRRWVSAMPRPRTKGDPYVFEDVAPGKYDFNLSILLGREWGPSIKQMFFVTPEEPNPTVTVEWPKGSASIRGTLDAPLRALMGRYGDLALVSPNERWRENVRVDERGRFELGEIPAGEYSVTTLRMRSGAHFRRRSRNFAWQRVRPKCSTSRKPTFLKANKQKRSSRSPSSHRKGSNCRVVKFGSPVCPACRLCRNRPVRKVQANGSHYRPALTPLSPPTWEPSRRRKRLKSGPCSKTGIGARTITS